MWDAFKDVLVSSNAVAVLTFLCMCMIVAFVLIKTGLLQVHTDAVKIGAVDIERNIIRQQLDYVKGHLKGIENDIIKPEGYNQYLGKYVMELIYDRYVDWTTFNHLSRSSKYIEIKQKQIVDLVKQYTIKEEFKTPEFIDFIREDTKETILELLDIREVYKNQGEGRK